MDYLSVYIDSNLINETPDAVLSLFLLAISRLYPIIALSPFFGARVLPFPVKGMLGISLFTIFLPEIVAGVKEPLAFNHQLIFLAVKEMMIGFILGLMISIPFTVVQTAGMIIDHQRGGASLQVQDPTVQSQSSPLGTLFNFTMIYIFFLIDGPFLFIDALYKSYQIVPVDSFLNPNFFLENSSFWSLQFELLNNVMIIATQLAGPGLITILMTDLFLGIANRLAPQVQIAFLGIPLKSLLALTVVGLGWKTIVREMGVVSFKWIDIVKQVVSTFIAGS